MDAVDAVEATFTFLGDAAIQANQLGQKDEILCERSVSLERRGSTRRANAQHSNSEGQTPPSPHAQANTTYPSRRPRRQRRRSLRKLKTYEVWLEHIDAKLEAWRDACAAHCDSPLGSPRQAPTYAVRVDSSRATGAAWPVSGDAWTGDQTFAPGACDASRFAFAVVRSEKTHSATFERGWFRRWSAPDMPEAVDVRASVGQVVLRVAAGKARISEESMKAPYLRARVTHAAWRGGCLELELEVTGRHAFRVARVVAETSDATQIHDAEADQRVPAAAHTVKLRLACAAPRTARPASPVNVVDEALCVDSVPDCHAAVRVLVLVE